MFQSFKHYGIFLLIAVFIGSVLLSNKAGVSLTHHHNLPQIAQQNKIYCSGTFSKKCSVRLTSGIGNAEQYQEILQLLSDASASDTVVFYLAGNGGQTASEIQLINAIKYTKAHTIAIVEGSVYSAHADLAISTKEVIVRDYLVFMFHRSSAYGQEGNCAKHKGKKDRKQDLEAKCHQYYAEANRQDEEFAHKHYAKYLTQEEIKRVLDGHDVFITSDQMKQRIKQQEGK